MLSVYISNIEPITARRQGLARRTYRGKTSTRDGGIEVVRFGAGEMDLGAAQVVIERAVVEVVAQARAQFDLKTPVALIRVSEIRTRIDTSRNAVASRRDHPARWA